MNHKNLKLGKEDLIQSFPVPVKALAICTVLWSESTSEWELELGGRSGRRRRFLPRSFSLLVVPLLDAFPPTLYSAPAAASSQPGGGYQILPALFGYNRGGVRRGFLHHLSYVCMEKSSPKWCCSRVEKALCRPEEFWNGRSCEFFMLCGF